MVRKRTKAKSSEKDKKKRKRRGGGDEDTRQRRKFARGGRIEAYTMGEALGKKRWP